LLYQKSLGRALGLLGESLLTDLCANANGPAMARDAWPFTRSILQSRYELEPAAHAKRAAEPGKVTAEPAEATGLIHQESTANTA
jgi:hypothetical protein